MKNQRTKVNASRLGFFKLMAIALTLVVLIGALTVFASAALKPDEHFTIDLEYSNGVPVKEYDGTTDAPVRLTDAALTELEALIEEADRALVRIECTANYNSAEVAEANTIVVTVSAVPADNSAAAAEAAAKYAAKMPAPQAISAKIAPKTVAWNYGEALSAIAVDTKYVMGQTDYTVKLTADQLPALNMENAPAIVPQEILATVSGVKATVGVGNYLTSVQVALNSTNYVAAPLNVMVCVDPIEIVDIVWQKFEEYAQYTFTWGDEKLFDVTAMGIDKDGNAYPMNVSFPANYGMAGVYNNVTVAATPGLKLAANLTPSVSVTIQKRVFNVSMKDASFIGNAGHQDPADVYNLEVEGDIPAEIRALIVYSNGDQSNYGTYDVTAAFPISPNYEFRNNGESVTQLTATMTIKKAYITASGNLPFQMILSNPEGFLDEVSATVTIPELTEQAMKKYPVFKAYTLAIKGGADDTFTLTIPISSELFGKNCQTLGVENLYVYDAVTGALTPVTQLTGYKVSLTESAYQVEGVAGETTLTFVIAPVYSAPFWGSVWSILLIVILVILLIVALFLIGLYQLRVRAKEEEEAVIDADGDAPEATTPEIEDTVDVEEAIEEKIEEVVEEAQPEVAEEEVVIEAVEEVVAETIEEVAAETEDAAPAVVLIEEAEDDDDDNDNDEDEGDSLAEFASMDLDFIDIMEEADKYAVMLEEESRGEVRLVTRYRRSYQSRLAQSQGNVQEYYNIIKNTLLSYKGVKNRISWNYEAFNRGRVHVAKLNAKTKTLYLYLALDPAEYAETKYGVIDMSSKKKYASVPVLMKIKGDRKFKYAIELIEKLCGENLALKKVEIEGADYKLPYQTTEELVQAGLIKKLVASVPVVYSAEPVLEEKAVPVSAATEAQEVTFIAPTDDSAVVAAAEEIAIEEANGETETN